MGRIFRALVGVSLVFVGVTGAVPAQEKTDDREQIVHVLNRITYGPCPGDVEAVEKMGVHAFIEQQLHPEAIDDSALEKQLAGFDLLKMSGQELMAMYTSEKMVKKDNKQEKNQAIAAANGQTPPPDKKGGKKKAAAMAAAAPPSPTTPAAMTDAKPDATMEEQAPPVIDKKAPVAKMLEMANAYRSVAAVGQLEQAKLVRAVESKRQLQEVLVDFWGNHFNIDVKKKVDRVLKVVDDREVIRPHILGKFRDLLEASAKSPAMLYYLDNHLNSAPDPSEMTGAHPILEAMMQKKEATMTKDTAMTDAAMKPGEVAAAPKKKKERGINENYAREIMELHTLGVDGGYTQKDVQEVARCFTGWTIDRDSSTFKFRPFFHDNGEKTVLGHKIPAGGGIKDGEMVLDILAAAPATAHHLSYQLCQRFVADAPPDALVDRIADVFTKTGGDLREVTSAILTSPEFLAPANYGNKIKSPLEFAVSAVRASGSTFVAQPPAPFDKILPATEGSGVLGRGKVVDRMSQRPRQSLNWHIYELGMPLFACTPPTGYKENSTTWVSPGALIERLNFAMSLTEQKVSDVPFDAKTVLGPTDLDSPNAVLDQCVAVLLQNHISPATKKVLEQTALPTGDSKTVNPNKLLALIIGSPEFQRK